MAHATNQELLEPVIAKIRERAEKLITRLGDPEQTVQLGRTYYDYDGKEWLVNGVIGNPYEEYIPSSYDYYDFGSYFECIRVIGGIKTADFNRVDVFGYSKYGQNLVMPGREEEEDADPS